MYFWQVISCNLFLNKNVKIAGKNCKIRKTFWCTVKVQWLTTSICWLSKGQWKYRGKWDAGKTCTFGSRNICSVVRVSIESTNEQVWIQKQSSPMPCTCLHWYLSKQSVMWIILAKVIAQLLMIFTGCEEKNGPPWHIYLPVLSEFPFNFLK